MRLVTRTPGNFPKTGLNEAVRNLVDLTKFIVAEVTSTVRDIASEVRLGTAKGLPHECVANCDNLGWRQRHRFAGLWDGWTRSDGLR